MEVHLPFFSFIMEEPGHAALSSSSWESPLLQLLTKDGKISIAAMLQANVGGMEQVEVGKLFHLKEKSCR